MVTTREVAPAVRLNADWQARYRQRAHQFLLHQQQQSLGQLHLQHPQEQQQDALSGKGELLSVCLVGRSGVGKGSLINHLLRQRASKASCFEADSEESTYNYHGLFCVRVIPGYDGWHSVEPSARRGLFGRRSGNDSSHSHSCSGHSSNSSFSHGSSSHSSVHSSSNGKGKKLNLGEFVKRYGLFEAETKAIIFVVSTRITPDDERLIELAVENRKFFCIVRTHADDLVQIADSALQKSQLDALEEQLRKDLSLMKTLNVRVFILSIPFPEGQATGEALEGPDLTCVMKNSQNLHFPLLQAYLSEPRGLVDELQIHGFVKEEVWNALEPYQNVKKRQQLWAFSEHLAAGTLLPIAGPVMVSFLKTLKFTLKACYDVGLIQDADGAMKEVDADAKKKGLSALIASKEGLVTAVHDSMIHIFGEVVYEIALREVISATAEAAVSDALPLVGPALSAASLPKRFKKIVEKLAMKACMLHELWIMQSITGLLGKAEEIQLQGEVESTALEGVVLQTN